MKKNTNINNLFALHRSVTIRSLLIFFMDIINFILTLICFVSIIEIKLYLHIKKKILLSKKNEINNQFNDTILKNKIGKKKKFIILFINVINKRKIYGSNVHIQSYFI